MNKLYANHKQVMKKLLMSHEQVPTVVILRLETGISTIPGVGCCMVVPHSCENKAISAPSWAWARAWAWAELGNTHKVIRSR